MKDQWRVVGGGNAKERKESRMESLTRSRGEIEIPMPIDIESGSHFSPVFHGKYQRIRFSVFRLERMPNAFESNARSRVSLENVEMRRVNLSAHCRHRNRKRVLHM